jgi:hypothetical protein
MSFLNVTGPVGQNDEEEIVMPGLHVQQAHPQQEEIMTEDYSPEDVYAFGQRLHAFGKERFEQGLKDAQSGLTTNHAKDMLLFANSEGGMAAVHALVQQITPAIWAEATTPPALASTPERWALISSIVTHSAGQWQPDELQHVKTPALHHLNNHFIPKDFSANAAPLRHGGGAEEELQMPWGDFFGAASSNNGQASTWQSPNNILRKMSQNGLNGNGHHT